MRVPFLGAHLSAAGGAWRAAAAAGRLRCRSLQLFLRPPGRWDAPELGEAEVVRFRAAAGAAGIIGRCFAHAPYLLNLASADASLRGRSVDVLVDELRRGGRLGLAGVVLHPGSAGTGEREPAEERCREAVAEAIQRAGTAAPPLLLEGTAGAGGHLGRTPEELARLVEQDDLGAGRRVGICLDTAHLWAAGFDLRGDGWDEVLHQVRQHWGLEAPDLLHANDTPAALGSRRDRHAPPGEGMLGEAFYRRALADPRLSGTSFILEIPPGKDNVLVARSLRRLMRWGRAPR